MQKKRNAFLYLNPRFSIHILILRLRRVKLFFLLRIKDNLFPNRDYNCVVMKSGRTFYRSGIPVALSTREFKYIQEITIN